MSIILRSHRIKTHLIYFCFLMQLLPVIDRCEDARTKFVIVSEMLRKAASHTVSIRLRGPGFDPRAGKLDSRVQFTRNNNTAFYLRWGKRRDVRIISISSCIGERSKHSLYRPRQRPFHFKLLNFSRFACKSG